MSCKIRYLFLGLNLGVQGTVLIRGFAHPSRMPSNNHSCLSYNMEMSSYPELQKAWRSLHRAGRYRGGRLVPPPFQGSQLGPRNKWTQNRLAREKYSRPLNNV